MQGNSRITYDHRTILAITRDDKRQRATGICFKSDRSLIYEEANVECAGDSNTDCIEKWGVAETRGRLTTLTS